MIATHTNKKKLECACDTDIEQHLQFCTKEVRSIENAQDVKKLNSQSIRVGSCVALHEAGKNGSFVQMRLRWRSLAFMMFFRNTIGLVRQHVEASANVS